MQNHQLSHPNTNKHFPLQHPVLKTQKQVFNADQRQSRCIIKCTSLFFKYFEVNVTERHIGHCMLSRCNGLRNALNPRFIGYRVLCAQFTFLYKSLQYNVSKVEISFNKHYKRTRYSFSSLQFNSCSAVNKGFKITEKRKAYTAHKYKTSLAS